MVYNIFCRYNPIRQDFLTVVSPAVMPTFIFTGNMSESMKGGVLMKSKHIATYGKETIHDSFYSNHLNDAISHKSTIAASAKVGYCKN